MSRIKEAFQNGKAFIPFITCGDPDLGTTKEIVKVMVDNGADLVELGIPFSDPTAEGPVIQGANLRALKGGVTTERAGVAGSCNQSNLNKIFECSQKWLPTFTGGLVGYFSYDYMKCRVLLWHRAVRKAGSGSGDGWPHPAGCAL